MAGINYALGVSSPTRGDGVDNIFISVSFHPRYQWVAIGIGSQMRGSTIFVIYTDGRGNVTVSPRDGRGNYQPLFNSSSTVTILDGSSANAQLVKANFKYAAPADKFELRSRKAAFIGSWKEGEPFSTMDEQVVLSYHDGRAQFMLNVEGADVGNSSNPFIRGAALGGKLTDTSMLGELSALNRLYKAHGSLMGVAWVAVLPCGAMIMRLGWGGAWAHAGLQTLGSLMVIAGYGAGYRLAQQKTLACPLALLFYLYQAFYLRGRRC